MVLITEPSTSFLTPQTTPEEVKSIKFAKKDVKTTQSNSDPENGGEDRAKRNGKPGTDPLPAPDTESDAPEVRRKPSLKRSKVIDQTPLLQNPSDTEAKAEGKKAQSSQSKTNGQYHKLFKEISKEELLKQSYTCALQKDMLFHGKLYVSDNWICFHSKVFGRGIKIVIPVLSVTLIKKTKTAILVPNALVIATADERHVFVSFLSRDTTYKFLKSICPHLEVGKMGHDSKPSSTESSFRSERPASLQLDFSAGFSDLDGVVRKRRQKLSESSSSGSQTPDYEKPAEFPPLPQKYVKAPKKGEVAVHADVHLQKGADPKHGPHRNGHVKPTAEPQRGTPPQPGALNSLLLLYLLLVCVLVLSSCYMAFKIMSLEERLSALGSLAEYPLNENGLHYRDQLDVGNAEIYGELSTNLLKLEKVQKNLRKLLEET
ncbi:GRAM domain-containing protein 2B-like isoform X2 [Anguilla rostrata]|uniref:GRAM domain-containing protein 2B-like isoform X2 n=1 Tax=Anguilla rostrata TaxID=7938 RepID=UPI0030CBB355